MKELSTATVLSLTEFVKEMHDRLEEKQAKYGDDWREPGQGVEFRLQRMLHDAEYMGKWVDVANFAMMLQARRHARDAETAKLLK